MGLSEKVYKIWKEQTMTFIYQYLMLFVSLSSFIPYYIKICLSICCECLLSLSLTVNQFALFDVRAAHQIHMQ